MAFWHRKKRPAAGAEPDLTRLPRHIGIIMDGNGRWAKKRGLPRTAGHAAGAETFRTIAYRCRDLGIPYLTVYAFSTENWKRPVEEVSAIMDLLRKYLLEALEKMEKDGFRIRFFGDLEALPPELRTLCLETEETGAAVAGAKSQINVCLNYGGRDEILRAASPTRSSPGTWTAGPCPTPTSSSGPAASCGCPISCPGSRLTPSSILPMCSGPISVPRSWTRPWWTSSGVSADLEAYNVRNRILVACVGVPVILVVLYVLPAPFTPALIAVLSAVGTYEALHAIGMNHPRIALYTAIVALAIPFWVYFGEPRQWGLLVLLVYLLAVFLEAFASHLRVKMDRVGAGFFFAFVISYCLSSVVRVGALELRTSYIFLPILIPFVVDAGAMLVGMFLGKHPLTPHLSPKKTVEGSVGGLVVGVVIAILYGVVFHFITKVEVNYYFLAVYGILGGVITQVGDLAFSYVKRNRKIKDFGHVFPGHGGVLDRFDSVIFCAPLMELLILWLPAFSKGAGA